MLNDDDMLRESELPDQSDMDPDMFDRTQACPYCKKSIDEDAEFCHHCGKFISSEDQISSRSWWIMFGVGVCLVITIVAWMLGQ